jgi:hypothetical protein
VQWFVGQAQKILVVKNRGNEEALSAFGFHVVVTFSGGRRFVRIERPESPEDMVELGRHIVDQHLLLAGASPLVSDDIDMDAFEDLVEETETMYASWETLRGEVQALHQEALNIIGYGPGQTIETEGTLYNVNRNLRDRLLQKYQGNEEQLSNWSMKVVVTTKKTGRKKGAPLSGLVILIVEVPMGFFKQVNPGDFDFEASTPLTVLASGSSGSLYAAALPTSPPGPGAMQSVNDGTPYNTTVGALTTALGMGPALPLLMVQNTGTTSGVYRFTFGG